MHVPRAIGDRPRNPQPWSNDVDDTCANGPLSKLQNHNKVRILSPDRFNMHQPLYAADLLWHRDSNS
ncbi:hypothetical protein TNCV_4299901 [Trichonephila clavipes]|nr:hypothetical protein TNCV_4299901 [Trichonephila clavipes]